MSSTDRFGNTEEDFKRLTDSLEQEALRTGANFLGAKPGPDGEAVFELFETEAEAQEFAGAKGFVIVSNSPQGFTVMLFDNEKFRTIQQGFPSRSAAWDFAETEFGITRPIPKENQDAIDAMMTRLFKQHPFCK